MLFLYIYSFLICNVSFRRALPYDPAKVFSVHAFANSAGSSFLHLKLTHCIDRHTH